MVCLSLFAKIASGQTATNETSVSNRWLLVLDISSTMQSREEAMEEVVAVLLSTGMNGQMQNGDTLGVWAYDDSLHAGEFPLQEWRPHNNKVIAKSVIEYIHSQTFKKEAKLDKVLPDMFRLIKASEFITVVLVSDGSGQITGTPFDEKINTSFLSWRDEQKQRQAPIVTFLRARDGAVTDFAVNTPPWPLRIPPLPAELLRPKPVTVQAAAAKPQPAAPPIIGQSLIVSGKNPEPEATPAGSTMIVHARSLDGAADSRSSTQIVQSVIAPTEITAPKQEEPQRSLAETPKVDPASLDSTSGVAANATEDGPDAQNSNRSESAGTQTKPSRAVQSAEISGGNVQTAVALPPSEKLWERQSFWLLVLAGLGATLILVLLFARQSRNIPRISLITRSFEREGK